MPLPIPTLSDLRTQTQAQFMARLIGVNPKLRRMLVKVLGDLVAGGWWLLYRFLVILSQQLFLDSADSTYLLRQAAIDGLSLKGATKAAGNAILLGAPDGTSIPVNLLLESDDHTWQYTTQEAGTIAGGAVTLPVEAIAGGAGGNLPAGSSLNLLIAVAGVQPIATVDSAGLTGGLDIESFDSLRARTLDRRRKPPQGGDANDYVQWARAVAGVTRAWVYPLRRGAGTVDVAPVMDARVEIVPLSGDLATVQAAIDLARPVTADAVVFALTEDSIPVTITNLVPNTAATHAAITAALGLLFAATTPGGATDGSGVSADVPGGTLYLEQISDAITQAGGIRGFDLTAPTADIASATGHIARLGTLTMPSL